MKDLREPLIRTEDAVDTIGGLAEVISYINDVASDADYRQLRGGVGFTLNAIGHEVRRARRGLGRARRRARRCRVQKR